MKIDSKPAASPVCAWNSSGNPYSINVNPCVKTA